MTSPTEISLAALVAATGLPGRGVERHAGVRISSVAYDSRRVTPDAIFVAIEGDHVDGHRFAAAAVAAGAVAVVGERIPEPAPAFEVPVLLVPSSRAALAALAAELAGHPSGRLLVAGITGTDGKTTTTTMLHAAWQGAGLRAGSLTTVDFRCGEVVEANLTRQTTQEALELQQRLRAMADDGCVRAALETSSHALVRNRVDHVDFGCAIFTRITSEHLDEHGDRPSYLRAKAGLLERTGARGGGIAVLDRDDDWAYPVLSSLPIGRRLSYSLAGNPAADATAAEVVSGPDGVRFHARTPWGETPVHLHLAGRFNAGNALAALCAACATGASLDGALAGLQRLHRVSGRMERVDIGQPFTVVIDYAHTAESLEKVLTELRAATSGRLWAVFGSAGERDRAKRPEMGEIAARLADRVVITDEDPRDENRDAICAEIAAGAQAAGAVEGRQVTVIPDRTAAITAAIESATAGDTVLLAGKGHESCILTAAGAVPWDERATAETAIRTRLARGAPRA